MSGSQLSRDELEDRVDELEDTLESLQTHVYELEDVILGDWGIAVAGVEAENRGSVLDRIEDLEVGEVDSQTLLEASESATLPIQQLTAARKAGHITDESDKNKYRATFVWSEFYERSVKDAANFKLTSQQVQNILQSVEEEDLPTDRNTVSRVMEFVAEFSNPDSTVRDPDAEGNYIRLKKRSGKNVLVADREQFESLIDTAQQELVTEADETFEQLQQAEVETDD